MHLGIIKITYNRTATHFMDDSFVNLGEESSESTTVCFVISLSICYWLFKWGVLRACVCVCVCVCVCEWVSERGRERERVTAQHSVCVCVCVWERERATQSHHNHGLFANTYELHHCVCHATLFLSQAWTDGKTKDIIDCLYIYFES